MWLCPITEPLLITTERRRIAIHPNAQSGNENQLEKTDVPRQHLYRGDERASSAIMTDRILKYVCRMLAFAVILSSLNCAGPAPMLMPQETLRETKGDGWVAMRTYDIDADGRADFLEESDESGVINVLSYDRDGDGIYEQREDAPAKRAFAAKQLVIILDSIPFDLVDELWSQGLFREFHKPGRAISTFPVMTDTALSELFGVAPCLAVEASYYDGKRLSNAYTSYLRGDPSPWLGHVDYYMRYIGHALTYLHPYPWFDHELRRIQQRFLQAPNDVFVSYCVGTSALGAQFGRQGHIYALKRVDRFCRWIIHQYHGDVHITLLSDHGHNHVPSSRINLDDALQAAGFKVRDRIDGPADVVLPAHGPITCAGVYTQRPEAVADVLVRLNGVDFAVYSEADDVVTVLSESGRAEIRQKGNLFHYEVVVGKDPLRLESVLAKLESNGVVTPDGYVDDQTLFAATIDHAYPDGVHRIWRAFHGLTKHTPDVLISIADGYHCGSKLLSSMIDLQAAHGNLLTKGSVGFVMSTAGTVPPAIRIGDISDMLARIGVPLARHCGAVR